MRINKTLAAILLATAALFQVPASAHTDTRAKLQVRIVDQTNAVLSHATVTLFTLDGNPGVTLTADEKGIVLFPSVASGLTQIVVKYPGFSPAIVQNGATPGFGECNRASRTACAATCSVTRRRTQAAA